MRVTSTVVAISLLSLSLPAFAQDRKNADPFRPVQPDWPAEWSGSGKAPTDKPAPSAAPATPTPPSKPAKAARKGEKPAAQAPAPAAAQAEGSADGTFLFDEEARPETASAAATVAEDSEGEKPAAEKPAQEKAAAPPVQASDTERPAAAPPPDIDLHVPHVWMATGGIIVGASLVGALVAGIIGGDKALEVAIGSLGGVVGIAGLTVGVVMQNNRYAAAGYDPKGGLPKGLALTVSAPLP